MPHEVELFETALIWGLQYSLLPIIILENIFRSSLFSRLQKEFPAGYRGHSLRGAFLSIILSDCIPIHLHQRSSSSFNWPQISQLTHPMRNILLHQKRALKRFTRAANGGYRITFQIEYLIFGLLSKVPMDSHQRHMLTFSKWIGVHIKSEMCGCGVLFLHFRPPSSFFILFHWYLSSYITSPPAECIWVLLSGFASFLKLRPTTATTKKHFHNKRKKAYGNQCKALPYVWTLINELMLLIYAIKRLIA